MFGQGRSLARTQTLRAVLINVCILISYPLVTVGVESGPCRT